MGSSALFLAVLQLAQWQADLQVVCGVTLQMFWRIYTAVVAIFGSSAHHH